MRSGAGGTETPLKTWIKEIFKFADLNAELVNIYAKLRGKVVASGDTMTGPLIMDGADIRVYDGNDIEGYSDGGVTKKWGIDSATGDVDTCGSGTFDGALIGSSVKGAILTCGQCVNVGIKYAAGVLSVCQANGSDFADSDGNRGYVCLPSPVTAGKLQTYTLTSNFAINDDAHASSDLTNVGFGITEAAHWANDMPFFIRAAGKDASTCMFFVGRNPKDCAMPAAEYIGDTDAAPSTDAQTSQMAMGSITEADYAAMPSIVVGSVRMQWSTTTDDWTVQALNATDGIGQFQKGVQFTMPLGQNGAQSGTYAPKPTNNSPVFSTNTYTYELDRSGYVNFELYQTGDGGNDGSDATTYYTVLPLSYAGTPATYIYGAAYQVGAGASAYGALAFVGSDATNFSLRSLSSTSAVNYNAFTAGSRSLVVRGAYPAF